MSTKARTRSPFQAPPSDGISAVYTLHRSEPTTGPEEKTSYLNREYIEYINAEGTIAVTRGYSSYDVIVKTDLSVADVVEADAEILTSEEAYYADLRERGVWYEVLSGIKAKTRAREHAEVLLQGVQDVQHPLHVALDGRFAPALTIALKTLDAEREFRRDDERLRAVGKIAQEAGVHPLLLALAVKENRLEWATPPVAPKQVMVVVKEDATGNLTERLVDEIVLAERHVEGLGRIVFEGGVPAYLLHRRSLQQQQSVSAILTAREKVEETLESLKQRVERLQKEVAEGQVIGRGFYDTLRLAEDTEKAQQAATAYATEVSNADLPAAFLAGLLKNEYGEGEGRTYRYVQSDIRESIKALAAINGMPINQRDYY